MHQIGSIQDMIRYLGHNSAKVRAGQQVSRSGDSQDRQDRLYLYTTPSFSGFVIAGITYGLILIL